ncbi:MAG: hypothetical protein V4623_01425 [Pseudomonadota bacterium]
MLYSIASTLTTHRINVHTAKIATLGERVEDTFLVSGGALAEASERMKLEAELLTQLAL